MSPQVIKYLVVSILSAGVGAAVMSLSHGCEAPISSAEMDTRDSIIARSDRMISSLLAQVAEKDTVYVEVRRKEKIRRSKINEILKDDFSTSTDSVKKVLIDEAMKNINNPL